MGMLSSDDPFRIGRLFKKGIWSMMLVPTVTLPSTVYGPGSNAAALFDWLINQPLDALFGLLPRAAAKVYATFDNPLDALNSLMTVAPAVIVVPSCLKLPPCAKRSEPATVEPSRVR